MSVREDRLDAIIARLNMAEEVEVDQLSTGLGVSTATVRRDLDLLADRLLLERTHGGARRRAVDYGLSRRYKEAAAADTKAAVAREAIARIPAGGVIGLSGGTTTSMVADALRERDELLEDLTVVTNAVDVAYRLAVHQRIKVVVCGGVLNRGSFELIGSFVDEVLGRLWLDVAFIGVNAFSAAAGGMTTNEQEAHVNRLMAARAETAIVVSDSSKYGKRHLAAIGGTDAFSTIITDDQLGDEASKDLADAGYEVVRARTGTM